MIESTGKLEFTVRADSALSPDDVAILIDAALAVLIPELDIEIVGVN